MSAIMANITSWNTRQLAADNLDRQGRRRNSDRTTMAEMARPLRDVAAQQGAVLRAVGSTGRKPAQARMDERVAAVRAAQNAPAPVARPAVASVPAKKPDFKLIGELANKLPEGFYALPRRADATTGTQPTYYFKIHKFRGGHRIVMVTGGVGAFVEHTMRAAWQLRALEGIAADVKGAAVRFGHETGTCGRCGSPLTNDTSRARGLGPHCAKQF